MYGLVHLVAYFAGTTMGVFFSPEQHPGPLGKGTLGAIMGPFLPADLVRGAVHFPPS